MQVEISVWQDDTGWTSDDTAEALDDAQLVIYFSCSSFGCSTGYDALRDKYPNAHIMGCTTGGEIVGSEVIDHSIVAAAIKFSTTRIVTVKTKLSDSIDSYTAGKSIGEQLTQEGLRHIFVLSDGIAVNGSELVNGIIKHIPEGVIVTGGLAGDGADFKETRVGLDMPPESLNIAAVGLYGDDLRIGYGSVGGWDAFGPERRVTRSAGNILYELDDKPALDLYKKYLGDEAKDLPGSGLLYPLCIRPDNESSHILVRTIVGIDEEKKSLIFAGDVPEGYSAQLMKGNFNNLVDGAMRAAEMALPSETGQGLDNSCLAILVSCIGRKLLMGQQISNETEAIDDIFQHVVPTVGFYSYGEICHHEFTKKCDLHNQTMTVTLFNEAT